MGKLLFILVGLSLLVTACKKDTPRPVYVEPPAPETKAPYVQFDSSSVKFVNQTGAISYNETLHIGFTAFAPGEFDNITLFKKNELGKVKVDSFGPIVLNSLTQKAVYIPRRTIQPVTGADTVSPFRMVLTVTDTKGRKDSASYRIYIKPNITLRDTLQPDSIPGTKTWADTGDAGSNAKKIFFNITSPSRLASIKLMEGTASSGYTEVGNLSNIQGTRKSNRNYIPYKLTQTSGSVNLIFVATDLAGYSDTAYRQVFIKANKITLGLNLFAQGNTAGGHYFSASNPNKSWTDNDVNPSGADSSQSIDMVYYFNSTDSASFAAPDVFGGPGASPPAGVQYPIDNWNYQNSTRFVRIKSPVNFESPAQSIKDYYDAVSPQVSAINNLKVGDIIAFKTNVSNKYGFLRISQIVPGDSGKIVFDIKIQQ